MSLFLATPAYAQSVDAQGSATVSGQATTTESGSGTSTSTSSATNADTSTSDGSSTTNTGSATSTEVKPKTVRPTYDVKNQVKRTNLQAEVEAKRAALEAEVKAKRTALEAEIKTKRANLQTEIQAKRDELKTRLEGVKDEVKKTIVTNVNARLVAINKTMTDNWSSALERLTAIVVKVSARADVAASAGADVGAIRSGITAANDAIAAAQLAVDAQAVKTYTINVTTEDKLRASVQAARQAMYDDLAKVRAAVVAAREAVGTAIKALTALPRPSVETGATTNTSGNVQGQQ